MLLPYVHVVRPLEPHACTRLGAQRADNGQSSKKLHEDEAMRREWRRVQLHADEDGDVRTCQDTEGACNSLKGADPD